VVFAVVRFRRLRPGLWLRVLVLAAAVVLDRGPYVGAWLRVVEPVVLLLPEVWLDPVVDPTMVDSPVVVEPVVAVGEVDGVVPEDLVVVVASFWVPPTEEGFAAPVAAAPGAMAVESAVADGLAEGVEFVLCSEF